jgi:hypothetical protein
MSAEFWTEAPPFATGPGQLTLGDWPRRHLSTRQLLDDVADAALFLRMGDSAEGLTAHALAEMRTELAESAAELVWRWQREGET